MSEKDFEINLKAIIEKNVCDIKEQGRKERMKKETELKEKIEKKMRNICATKKCGYVKYFYGNEDKCDKAKKESYKKAIQKALKDEIKFLKTLFTDLDDKESPSVRRLNFLFGKSVKKRIEELTQKLNQEKKNG